MYLRVNGHFLFLFEIPELSERRLKVKQYQYTSWPHHSVPDNAGAFVSFCKVAAASDNDSNTGPIVVHDR